MDNTFRIKKTRDTTSRSKQNDIVSGTLDSIHQTIVGSLKETNSSNTELSRRLEELQNEIYILKGKLENQKEVECGKLQETLMNLNRQLGEKNDIIKELRNKVEDLENLTKTSYAFYLKSSNLKDRL